VTFTDPGTYQYDCSVHGQAMTGRIVVLPAASPSNGGGYDVTATAIAGVTGALSAIVSQSGHLELAASNQNAERVTRSGLTAYLTPEVDR
jgi:predicted aconitase with swiveling domain